MNVSITKRTPVLALFGLLGSMALPAVGQEHPFSHIDDELLHLTPVSRQLDYINFQPSLGAFKTIPAYGKLFHFDNVLLPATTWMDDDPDSTVKRHLATANDIRHSVIPQTNPHGTLSFLLNGNGETPLDSEEGQAGFRSNGPSLPDATNPDAEIPVLGSWLVLPALVTLSRLFRHLQLRKQGDSAS